ncbi:xanthine-guanine phosphoribosyltransferase [Klebsiella pneumoniae subsp. rhinoscleromatis]|nr:xanthine-guanine phosphoribosyltransferase [Klebsiella pneumoniae subsp. rhinoscleromatis]
MSEKIRRHLGHVADSRRKLASRLLPVEQWKGIIAVSRGGLVPEPYWRVNWAFVMLIPYASPATTMITSAS